MFDLSAVSPNRGEINTTCTLIQNHAPNQALVVLLLKFTTLLHDIKLDGVSEISVIPMALDHSIENTLNLIIDINKQIIRFSNRHTRYKNNAKHLQVAV